MSGSKPLQRFIPAWLPRFKRLLLSRSRHIESRPQAAMSCQDHNQKVVNGLHPQGRQISSKCRRHALCHAAELGCTATVEILLRARAELDLEGGHEDAPLVAACAYGRLEIVQLLVRQGACVSCVQNRVSSTVSRQHDITRRLYGGCWLGDTLIRHRSCIEDLHDSACSGIIWMRTADLKEVSPLLAEYHRGVCCETG